MNEYDVVALGELLIDFTYYGKSKTAKYCLNKIPAVLRQMFYLLLQKWEVRQLLSAKWETICMGDIWNRFLKMQGLIQKG